MKKEKLNNQNKSSKEGYVVVPNYFLRERVKVLGVGPAMLYLYLLTYCHKEKDIAWPTISTLSKKMNLTPKTITRYRQILVKYGLIKKVSKRKTSSGCHVRNIYQLTSFDMGKNNLPIGNIFPYLEGNFTPDIRENLPTNNNNLKHYQFNNNKERKDAAVAVVDFKKLKEKGEEKMLTPHNSKENYTGQAIKEQLADLDFGESFIEKLLKDFNLKKIEEKLDLLLERRNIKNPAGWLMAALKNDYQDVEQPSQPTPHPHLNPPPSRGRKLVDNPHPQKERKFTDCPAPQREEKFEGSREKAIEAIKLIQDNLSACTPALPSGGRGLG